MPRHRPGRIAASTQASPPASRNSGLPACSNRPQRRRRRARRRRRGCAARSGR